MNRFPIIQKLGMAGLAGAGLLLCCIAFFLGATLPARAQLESLNAEKVRLAAAANAGPSRAALPPMQKLPPLAQAPEQFKQLNALAQKDGIAVTRSTYQVKPQDTASVFEVDLPLKATYPALRNYLRDVLGTSPNVRLDDLDLHRATASDPLVDADVRLSFDFAAAS